MRPPPAPPVVMMAEGKDGNDGTGIPVKLLTLNGEKRAGLLGKRRPVVSLSPGLEDCRCSISASLSVSVGEGEDSAMPPPPAAGAPPSPEMRALWDAMRQPRSPSCACRGSSLTLVGRWESGVSSPFPLARYSRK